MKFRRRPPSFQKGLLLFVLVPACVLLLRGGVTFSHSTVAAEQSQGPSIRVEVDLQPIDVQVQDAKGNDVLGLTASEFTVMENGQRQKIAFFDSGNSPVSLAILVDSSSTVSSNDHVGSAQAIASRFMSTARPEDEISAMDFTDQMGPFQRLTSIEVLQPSSFHLISAVSGGSALYDAIATALCHLRVSKNLRQAVIVISDGVDQHSHISLAQLIELVRSSRAQLFMIGLRSRSEFGLEGPPEPKLTLVTGRDIDNPVVVFDDLMKGSGAEAFLRHSQGGLEEALKAVSNLLQSEYTLAYYPSKTSEKVRKIEVKVDRHGVRVLARRFVQARQQGAMESVRFDEAACTVSAKSHPYAYESKVTHGASGMVYHEDFLDTHSGWPIHKDSHYVSGGYELLNLPVPVSNVDGGMRSWSMGGSIQPVAGAAAKPMPFRRNIIAAYGPWWVDFQASVALKMTPVPESHGDNLQFSYAAAPAAGLVFRMNQKGYYALLLSDSGKKNVLVELVRRDFLPGPNQDYSETQIVPWISVASGPASTTTLSVHDVRNQISIFVNGLELNSVSDDSYGQGLVGLLISGPGRATFKDLVVEQR